MVSTQDSRVLNHVGTLGSRVQAGIARSLDPRARRTRLGRESPGRPASRSGDLRGRPRPPRAGPEQSAGSAGRGRSATTAPRSRRADPADAPRLTRRGGGRPATAPPGRRAQAAAGSSSSRRRIAVCPNGRLATTRYGLSGRANSPASAQNTVTFATCANRREAPARPGSISTASTAAARRERRGEHAGARTEVDDPVGRLHACVGDDALGELTATEKVLPEALRPMGRRSPGHGPPCPCVIPVCSAGSTRLRPAHHNRRTRRRTFSLT